MNQPIIVVPVATVVGGRSEPTDDYWGGSQAIIRIDADRFPPDCVAGLDEFSHIEVVFQFHLVPDEEFFLGAYPSRNNPAWPATGTFVHRNMRRVNRLGVSRCRLLKVDGLDLHVEDLDAVDGTPILEIKPWFTQMGPRGEVRQPAWPGEMLKDYYTRS